MTSVPPLPDVRQLLDARSVAVIGASEDQTKFGGRLFRMLLRHRFGGRIYPVSPSRSALFGVPTVPSVAALPEAPDLAVILIPRNATPGAVRELVERGAKGIVIVTAQFSDAGPEGAAVEREMVEVARQGGTRIWGPNCLGIISPARRLVLNSSPALEVESLIQSPVGFVTQSGALLGTLFDKAHLRGFGFSHLISVGNQADLEICDFVEFLVDDPDTELICTYVEGLKDPTRFVALAGKARAAGKPWLMLKSGRTEAGARAAFSHTASLAGSYRAFAAICEENGIVLVDDQDALQLLAACLVRYPKRTPRRLAVLTPSGGSAALTSDRASDAGLVLAEFGPDTLRDLKAAIGTATVGNPVDYGGNPAPVIRGAMEAVTRDPGVDAALCVITTAPALDQACAALSDAAEPAGLPTLFVMHPGAAGNAARQELVRRQAPYADSLDEAMRVLAAWTGMGRLGTEPSSREQDRPADLPPMSDLPTYEGALGEADAKALLESYGVATNRGLVAADPESAARDSEGLSFPVVVKVVSPDIVHKSDVGGVALGLADPDAVREAIREMDDRVRRAAPDARIEGFLIQEMVADGTEFIVGVNVDEQFGPMVVVGAGGILVELLDDVAVAPAPVSPAGARRMLSRLKAARLLDGVRGRPPLDADALARLVSRVSWLASDLGSTLLELDINPVLVRAEGRGCVAVDGRALFRDGAGTAA